MTHCYIVTILAATMLIITSSCSLETNINERDVNFINWKQYKNRFLMSNGRILDTNNGNISHSEGQGTAMLFAVTNNDRRSFEQIWRWTVEHLQIRGDALFAWKWNPSSLPHVKDKNNASDGDIMIAWALYQAHDKWQTPKYLEAAKNITSDIKEKLLRKTPLGLVLLPGERGFIDEHETIVNLSYWIFPAFNTFFDRDNDQRWMHLIDNGIQLLQAAQFGKWNLPPDWLAVSATLKVSKIKAPYFSYDAVRIPLFLIWGKAENTQLIRPYLHFWNAVEHSKRIPDWANLVNNRVSETNALRGVHAIRYLVEHRVDYHANKINWNEHNYYSASLQLMANLAGREISDR